MNVESSLENVLLNLDKSLMVDMEKYEKENIFSFKELLDKIEKKKELPQHYLDFIQNLKEKISVNSELMSEWVIYSIFRIYIHGRSVEQKDSAEVKKWMINGYIKTGTSKVKMKTLSNKIIDYLKNIERINEKEKEIKEIETGKKKTLKYGLNKKEDTIADYENKNLAILDEVSIILQKIENTLTIKGASF